MGALAYIQQLPPLIWGVAFFLGVFAVAIIRAINAWAYERRSSAKYLEIISLSPKSVNPLKQTFDREKISLSDFWNILVKMRSYKGQVFRDCHIHGPGAIVLYHGCTIRASDLSTCDLVCVTAAQIQTGIVFENSVFDRCIFVSATMYLARNICDLIVAEAKKNNQPEPQIIGYNEKP